MNTHVDFETAKLLKEKGFDKKVIGRYSEKHWNSAFEIGKYFVSNYPINDSCIYAPTIAEVVMWLYEKHEIWISVEQNAYEDKFDYLITQRNKDGSWLVSSNDDEIFKSPTEACQEAIKYCLTKLI